MSGVDGIGDIAGAITRLGAKLVSRMRHRHGDMLAEMIQTAKARVPVDTGALLNGIGGRQIDDDAFEFTAEAVHGAENYARDIEFGHGAGHVVVADDDYFAGRTSRSGNGQVAAEPFFFNSADEVLQAHGHELSDIAPGVAREDGWETS